MGELTIDLNADLGEEVTDDAALLGLVTSANVACGYHAGNSDVMQWVCAEAVRLGVVVGAQVSYADRENFGREPLDIEADVLRQQVADQIGVLSAIAIAEGTTVRYLKPHGALYHRVLDDAQQAEAVLSGSGPLPVLTMPGELGSRAAAAGRPVFYEGFADRTYDGERLLPRSEPGALLEDSDDVAAQAVRLAGQSHPSIASVCVHGDTPGAVAHATLVRRGLEDAGWTVAPFVTP